MVEEKSCEGCDGACCKYVAMEIDCPEDYDDFENIRWYVAHKNISVFVEEDHSWNVEFITPCEYLDEEGKCSIHEDFVEEPEVKRPDICKNFSTDQCPHHNDYQEKYRFNLIEEVDKYIKEVYEEGEHIVPEDEE